MVNIEICFNIACCVIKLQMNYTIPPISFTIDVTSLSHNNNSLAFLCQRTYLADGWIVCSICLIKVMSVASYLASRLADHFTLCTGSSPRSYTIHQRFAFCQPPNQTSFLRSVLLLSTLDIFRNSRVTLTSWLG